MDALRLTDLPAALTDLLERAGAAERAGDRDGALRLYDRAFRSYPSHSRWTAPAYGCLLAAGDSDPSATLAVLHSAVTAAPTAAVAAALVATWMRLGQVALAQACLEPALATHAFTGPLRSTVEALVASGAWPTPGVVGVDVAQDVVVIVRRSLRKHLRVSIDGRAVDARRWRVREVGALALIRVRRTAIERTRTLVASVGGHPLTGSPRGSIDPGLLGEVREVGRRLVGRVECRFAPTAPVEVRVRDEQGAVSAIEATIEPAGGVKFVLQARPKGLRGDRWTFEARLRGVGWHPFTDAPWLTARAALRVPSDGTGRRAPRRAPPRAPVAIIVPVYADLDETLACLESVAATRPLSVRLIVVDDASPEPGLSAALAAWAARRCELIRHPTNRGFSAAVNTAAAAAPGHDLILLNSDTRVHGDWVERLQRAAYADPKTGSVTPWTDDGTLTSLGVDAANGRAPAETLAALDRAVATTFAGETAGLPVGVGFCLYVRHDAWAATGSLDAAVFGVGYGEETDFCLRARGLGYRSVQALDVLVHHAGGRSFGARRAALLKRSERLLELRHPGYHRRVARYFLREPAAPNRRRLDEVRLLARSGPTVLFVSHGQGGGVRRHLEERCERVRGEGRRTLVLEALPERAGWVRLTVEEGDVLGLRFDASRPAERRSLVALLRRLALVAVEIHHTLGIPAPLVEALRSLGVAYDVSLHDYHYLCPRITFLGPEHRYCGEPPVRRCAACVRRLGSASTETISVAALRARSARWLAGARRVVAPSRDTAARYERHVPGVRVEVVPHGEPPEPRTIDAPRSTGPVRVALIGGIGDSKGHRVLLACARDAKRRRLPLEFVVIGHTHDDAALERTGRVFVTGRYLEGEAGPLLDRERPDVVFMASVWPETWCYALDVALASGLPILAFDLGAIAERLRSAGRGRLVALGTSSQLLNAEFLTMASRIPSTDAS